ncbi:MAG: glycosyltransferase family 4 protein [Arenicellales bacterium]
MHDGDLLQLTTQAQTSAKIALVADTPGWVFSRIADRVRERLGPRHDVRIVFSSPMAGYQELLPALFDTDGGFDLVHFFWREGLSDLFHPGTWVQLMKFLDIETLKRLAPRVASTRKTTWVCDHLFLDQTLPSLWSRRCLAYATSYGVSSKILKRVYAGITPEKEIHELQDGVDLESFGLDSPGDRSSKGMVLVGWAGNSEWGRKGEDHKGLHTVIKPAIDRLRAARLPVRHRFCDRSQGWTPFEEMPQYYRSLDIFTCASTNEGTPNTVLEAMACGLPIVSTRVGIVEEAFGPLQRQFIVDNRSVNGFEKALRTLIEDPALRARVGEENLARIREWDWNERVSAWGTFIENALERGHDPESEREQLSTLNRSMEIARERLANG